MDRWKRRTGDEPRDAAATPVEGWANLSRGMGLERGRMDSFKGMGGS